MGRHRPHTCAKAVLIVRRRQVRAQQQQQQQQQAHFNISVAA
jgi:hypothetical protein